MKLSFTHGLVATGIIVPTMFFAFGMGTWAVGCIIGECLGLISYIWIGLSVKRILSKRNTQSGRTLIIHSLGRYIMMGLAIYLSIKTPTVSIWGLVIGYSIIQLPAAIIRALVTTNGSKYERNT